MKLIKTGIAGLDEFLGGGLPPRVFLLLGPPGSGSEVFAREVAHSRAKDAGVTYFTLTRTPEDIRDDMATYGWDTTQLEKTGNWRFTNLTQAESMIDAVTGEIKQHRCVVIDSLSELLLTHETEEAISLLNSMAAQNSENPELHMILLTREMQEPTVETTMQHFAEGVITFTTTWETEATLRTITIQKIRGALAPTRSIPYSIGEKGLTIETAIRII